MLGTLVYAFVLFCGIMAIHTWLFDPNRKAPKQYREYQRRKAQAIGFELQKPEIPTLMMADVEPKSKSKNKQLNLF